MIFLFLLLGWSFLAGLAWFLVGSIFGYFFTKLINKASLEQKEHKDKRLNVTVECINYIKTLKFYQWIEIFQNETQARYLQEQKSQYFAMSVDCYMAGCTELIPRLMSTSAFYVCIRLHREISLSTAFTALIFFDKINNPLQTIPRVLVSLLDLTTSLKRLQNFFDEKELVVENFIEEIRSSETIFTSSNYSIQISKSSFSWGLQAEKDTDPKKEGQNIKDNESNKSSRNKQKDVEILEEDSIESLDKTESNSVSKKSGNKKSKKIVDREQLIGKHQKVNEDSIQTVSIDSLVVLKDISINVKKGEFVCIIGDVASGKSSLLNTIIGDLIPVNQR